MRSYLKMEINSYQVIKDFILKKLQDIEGTLPKDKINEEITSTQEIISKVGLLTFSQILSVEKLEILNLKDWERMERELETHFNIKMDKGILVQGQEQQKRDNTWWTAKDKQQKRSYYWGRYKEYMSKSLSLGVVKTIDDDTDSVMDNIEDPLIDNFSRVGMVVGHVQSGKTGNYSALVCKAADAGYKFIVVIAGGMNNLRDQTQVRMNEAFIGIDKGSLVGVGKLGGMISELLPISLTTAEQDFNKRDAEKNSQGLNFDNISSPVLLVIKKNSKTLKNVIDWLETQYKNQIEKHAMLMIDDESDYASINTKSEEDPTIINKRLRELLNLFCKSAYVAYTATPYANIFIDHQANHDDVGSDIFPKDFIYALKTPDNYFGAKKIFLDPDYKHIIKITDHNKNIPFDHKKDDIIYNLPESLYIAVRHFIINIGIRKLRGQGNQHNSMLIHVTRFTAIHQKVSIHIYDYINKLKETINAYGRLPNTQTRDALLDKLFETFNLTYPKLEFSWEEILIVLTDLINTVIVREVHKDTKIPLEYRKDTVTNAIVIGGTSLSRGYTLEGLSISYFLRNTIFYDTLMQMGRWFGYRPNYEDLCYIYMPEEVRERFKIIIEATDDLIDILNEMSKAKMTPNDFGLSVKYHPDSGLQVTARNKQKNSEDIYFEMRLDGTSKETKWISKDVSLNEKNLSIVKSFLTLLQDNYESNGNSYLWRNIDKKEIFWFLNKFKLVPSDQFGLNSRMPIDFIKEYVDKINTLWDIALYSGRGEEISLVNGIIIKKEERKFIDKNGYYEILQRQVSSGNAETISLSEKEKIIYSNDRKGAREKLKNPLLMLHIIDGKIILEDTKVEIDCIENICAFGISFPGGIKSGHRTVKVKINSVTIKNLIEKQEEDSDDGED